MNSILLWQTCLKSTNCSSIETSTAAAQPEEATSPASVMAEDPAEGETEEAAPEAAATVNAAGDGESVKPKGPTGK